MKITEENILINIIIIIMEELITNMLKIVLMIEIIENKM
jgi:hypothetical protein